MKVTFKNTGAPIDVEWVASQKRIGLHHIGKLVHVECQITPTISIFHRPYDGIGKVKFGWLWYSITIEWCRDLDFHGRDWEILREMAIKDGWENI